MANEVRIAVSAETTKAEKGFQNMNKQLKETQKQVGRTNLGAQGLGGSFKGFAQSALGAVGASLSLAFAFKQITEGMSRVTQTAAFTNVVIGGFTDDFKANLEKVAPSFEPLGKQFAFTQQQARNAFAIMTREARTATVGIDDIAGAMALAQVTGMELSAAATVMGQAFLGNVSPLRKLVGEVESYEGFLARIIPEGKLAATEVEKLGAGFAGSVDKIAEEVEALLRGDFSGLGKLIWQDLVDTFDLFKSDFGFIGDAAGALFRAGVLHPIELLKGDFNALLGFIKDKWKGFGLPLLAIGFTVEAFKPPAQAIIDAAMWLWDHKSFDFVPKFGAILSGLWDTTVAAAKWLWDHLSNINIVASFTENLGNLFEWAVGAARWLWHHLSNINVVAGFKTALGDLWNTAVASAKWLWGHLSDINIVAGFKTALGDLWNVAVDAAKWLWDHKDFSVDINFDVVGTDLLEKAKELLDSILPGIGGGDRGQQDRGTTAGGGFASNPGDQSPGVLASFLPQQRFAVLSGGQRVATTSNPDAAIAQGFQVKPISFKHGGIVPGPEGREVPAILHGMEEVLTPDQRREVAGLPGAAGLSGGITIQIMGNVILDNESRLTEMADMIQRQLEIKHRRGLNFT